MDRRIPFSGRTIEKRRQNPDKSCGPVCALNETVLSNVAKPLALLSLLALGAGCAAAPKHQATTPEAYDWSDYKGTYAAGGDSSANPTGGANAVDKSPSKTASSGDGSKNLKAEMLGGAGAPAASSGSAAAASKRSRGTISGESVSSVSVDAVAGASKSVLKSKVVSSNVVVGQEYEQLQVVMKGVALQIIRPAATPDKAGPKVRSPKARQTAMSKSESGWYDADADVFVLVKAGRKASSQKTLAAILNR
jgi:hypothetical protein